MKRKNPYVTSYLYLAVICSVIASVIFIYLNHDSLKRTRIQYDRMMAEVLIEDWEKQIEQLEEFALNISFDRIFSPIYFSENKYYESEVLNDLERYANYSALVQECFLYYPSYDSNLIFHSTGLSARLDVFLSSLSGQEKESLMKLFEEKGTKMYYLSTTENVFVVKPIKVTTDSGRSYGIICFILDKHDLKDRFLMISGGNAQNVALYMEETLIYSSDEEIDFKNKKEILTADTSDNFFTIYYLPSENKLPWNHTHFLTMILLALDIILIGMLAKVFANHSYRPIEEMSGKYRKEVLLSDNVYHENALEEIDYLLDNMIKNNMSISLQMEQKQKMLRKQLLQMLIAGYSSADIQTRLDKLQIKLKGPFYFVMCISFGNEKDLPDGFLTRLAEELEQDAAVQKDECIYTLCDNESSHINVILSISEKSRKKEMAEYVESIASSYDFCPVIGIGNIYGSLSKLSASWLESTDNMNAKATIHNAEKKQGYIYHSDELLLVYSNLSAGNQEGALEALDHFVKHLESRNESVLMQRYIFADFIGEIIRLAKEYHIDLSSQNISLIVSAKDIQNFKDAAQCLINEFCEKIIYMRSQTKLEAEYKAYEYVNEHFAEYDLSIEKVADTLGISTAAVRQAVLKYTGKMYKDHLISLRIEYAKHLLESEDISIAETCQRVGYTNLSYFTKLFKEMTGTTPSKYKKDRFENLSYQRRN